MVARPTGVSQPNAGGAGDGKDERVVEIATELGMQHKKQEHDLFGVNSDEDDGDSGNFQMVPEEDVRDIHTLEELEPEDIFGGMTQENPPAATVDNASVASCNSQQTISPGHATLPSGNQTGPNKRRRTTDQADAASSKRRAGGGGRQGLSFQAGQDNQGTKIHIA